MKKITKLFLLFLLLNSSFTKSVYAFEYDGVEYFITQEEERIGAYTLEIKNVPYSYTYSVIKENGTYYFPIFEFLKTLNIKNYTYKNGVLTIAFGDNSDKRVIDLKKLDKNLYIYEDNDFYLKRDLFEEYFFETLRINEENFTIKTKPNFILPNELNNMLKNEENRLREDLNKEVLIYEGERKLFDLGNLRIEFDKEINRGKDSDGKKYDWSGNLEYSGSLLYGNFLTDYDLKEEKFGDFELSYHDLKENYELNLGVYGEDREKGFTFRKDRGYYQSSGREYIIEEKVPIGSKVELIYNFFPIDIQNEEGGKVVFVNSLIKTGREFTLKIYEPDGKITERLIKINEDYNQQAKGEFGYDLYFREDKESDRNNSDLNIFYGYTDNLTLGFSFKTEPEMFNDRYIYSKTMGSEFIYSNSVDGNPYTLTYSYEKSLNKQKNEELNFQDKYRHRVMLDADIDKLNINFEQYTNGKYYDEKREIYLDADYDLTENLSLTGSVEEIKYHNDTEKETDYYYGFEYSESWRNLLVSYEIENHKVKQIRHSLDFYYTGFRNFTVRLENTLDEDDKFESELKINNTRWLDNLDLSFGARYSEDEKVEYMLEFTLKFDNWFEFGSSYEKDGRKRTYAGIDRVISLKNPLVNMNSLENTIIKTIAFLDKNNNNKMEEDEERIEGVEIALGKKQITTNENGEGYIYGIPSYTEYELTAQSKRPSHDGKATKIKVKGLGSSEVIAYIPIKPLITFMGQVEFPKDELALQDVKLKISKNGESRFNKIIYLESNGEFYIDSLVPGKYNLEIEYVGSDYNIESKKEEIELTYTEENAGENYYYLKLKEGKK